MTQAIVKPEDLRRFAADLGQFNNGLKDSTSRLQAQFKRLAETWRDQEHARFASEFQQTMSVLRRFMQVSEQHIPFLLRKAEKAEAYLQQR
jgi:uncharacterized protein YukE